MAPANSHPGTWKRSKSEGLQVGRRAPREQLTSTRFPLQYREDGLPGCHPGAHPAWGRANPPAPLLLLPYLYPEDRVVQYSSFSLGISHGSGRTGAESRAGRLHAMRMRGWAAQCHRARSGGQAGEAVGLPPGSGVLRSDA